MFRCRKRQSRNDWPSDAQVHDTDVDERGGCRVELDVVVKHVSVEGKVFEMAFPRLR